MSSKCDQRENVLTTFGVTKHRRGLTVPLSLMKSLFLLSQPFLQLVCLAPMNNNSIVTHNGTTGSVKNLATSSSTTVSHPSTDVSDTNSDKATSVHHGSLTTSTSPGVTTSNGVHAVLD